MLRYLFGVGGVASDKMKYKNPYLKSLAISTNTTSCFPKADEIKILLFLV